MIKKISVVAALMCVLFAAGLPADGICQEATAMFVVYGAMYDVDSVTVIDDESFIITVHNMTTGRMDMIHLGVKDGPGRYSVIWVDSEGGVVAHIGDEIKVTAEHSGSSEYFYAEHPVTAEDISRNRVEINVWIAIGVEHASWGAIKAIYRTR